MSSQSLNHLFLEAVERYQKPDAFRVKREGQWESVSHLEFAALVRGIAAGLKRLGVARGDRVAILSPNRLEWAAADFGILANRAVTVPIYPTLLAHQVEFILRNSAAKVVVAADERQLKKVLAARDQLPDLKSIVVIDAPASLPPDAVAFEALTKGSAATGEGDFREAALAATADDLATIIYTSGTTGVPKGVMLTHGNFVSNIEAILDRVPMDHTDTCLSFLPLSHVLERMAGHFLMVRCGVTIAYAESVETVQPNLVEVRPTVMISVPRLYEKIHSRVVEMVGKSAPVRQRLFSWALGVGWQEAELRMRGRRAGGLLAAKFALADRLVFSKLRERTGGRIRFFISGGAPLSPDVAKFFFSAGFTIYEGYGLTETSPVIAVNQPGQIKLGTVGPVIPGVQVKIAADGEILCKGPNVMRGYYKNDDATGEVFDAEGWFHTGDVGELDEEGYLRITDRKKDILVTAGGKNIAPQPIENLLKTSTYINEAVLIADRRKFPSVLIVPNFDTLRSEAMRRSLGANSPGELVEAPDLVALVRSEVKRLSATLAAYERPKKVQLLASDFTIESGELTPTLKVKRKVILEKHREVIAQLYNDGG